MITGREFHVIDHGQIQLASVQRREQLVMRPDGDFYADSWVLSGSRSSTAGRTVLAKLAKQPRRTGPLSLAGGTGQVVNEPVGIAQQLAGTLGKELPGGGQLQAARFPPHTQLFTGSPLQRRDGLGERGFGICAGFAAAELSWGDRGARQKAQVARRVKSAMVFSLVKDVYLFSEVYQ